MSETLYRSVEIGDTVGRTLSGIAMPWDKPTFVRDLTGPRYLEAFSPTSTDVSLSQHANFPGFVRHNYGVDPLGVVTFQRSAEALMFEYTLSKTRDADDKLELVKDGAMRAVSVGFKPDKAARRSILGRMVDQYRTEVRLRELSLAPTGFGQYAEAGVMAVRSEADDDPGAMLQAVDAVIDAAHDALRGGNVEQAIALLTAADVTVDSILDMFGLADADDTDEATMPARMVVERGRSTWQAISKLRHRETLSKLPTLPV